MPCESCQNRGVIHNENEDTAPVTNNGYKKLNTINWLNHYKSIYDKDEIVEIQFKNTRKEYYLNYHQLVIQQNDIVAVETTRGHDIGTVTLTGSLVWNQIKKKNIAVGNYQFNKIYRKATKNDIRVWYASMEKEKPVMTRSRAIIKGLGLEMKLSDVEFQGDGTKAIFYYIAEKRVDFRELIKVLAKEFYIALEMKQIGARQEAGRIGGIGSCGRELCCSSWRTNLKSVPVNASKIQELPGNIQRLTGQCGKLKCCMMYELDTYMEAKKDMPRLLLELETTKGIAYHQKTDILKKIMYYSFNENSTENLIPVTVNRVKEIIGLNKKGIKVEYLTEQNTTVSSGVEYTHLPDSIDRFQKKRSNKRLR